MLCYAILHYTILYYTILYYTILYYTILYYTILYYTTRHAGRRGVRRAGATGGGCGADARLPREGLRARSLHIHIYIYIYIYVFHKCKYISATPDWTTSARGGRCPETSLATKIPGSQRIETARTTDTASPHRSFAGLSPTSRRKECFGRRRKTLPPCAFSKCPRPISLPKIRRQRVLQAFSVPGSEQLQKLLSVGP